MRSVDHERRPGAGRSRATVRPRAQRRRGLAALDARLKGRPDSEHEQVLIRVAIALGCLLYLSLAALGDGHGASLAGVAGRSGSPISRARCCCSAICCGSRDRDRRGAMPA